MGRPLRKLRFLRTKEETNCFPKGDGDFSARIGRLPNAAPQISRKVLIKKENREVSGKGGTSRFWYIYSFF